MGLVNAPLAAGLNAGVQAFYQGQDTQREQQRQAVHDQQQRQLTQQEMQKNQLQLNQMKQEMDASGGNVIWRGLATGDLAGAEKQINDLFPDDPIKLSQDPNDKTGDTFIVTGKDGTPHKISKTGMARLYDVAGNERNFKAGMEEYKTNADLNLEAAKAQAAQELEKTKQQWIKLGANGSLNTQTGKVTGGGLTARGGRMTDLQFVTQAVGGDVNAALNMLHNNPKQMASRLFMAAKSNVSNYGKSDEEIMGQVMSTMKSLQSYDPSSDQGDQSGGDSGNSPAALSPQQAIDRATQEASDKAGWLSTDTQDFGPGGREKWITDRAQQIMQGGGAQASGGDSANQQSRGHDQGGLVSTPPNKPAKAATNKSAPSVRLPPQIVSQLKPGHVATLSDGTRWTLQDGQPVQVK